MQSPCDAGCATVRLGLHGMPVLQSTNLPHHLQFREKAEGPGFLATWQPMSPQSLPRPCLHSCLCPRAWAAPETHEACPQAKAAPPGTGPHSPVFIACGHMLGSLREPSITGAMPLRAVTRPSASPTPPPQCPQAGEGSVLGSLATPPALMGGRRSLSTPQGSYPLDTPTPPLPRPGGGL